MASKHIASRVDPGLPQPSNTLNDDLVGTDAVTAPDDSLATEDSLTGEAVTVTGHEATEAGTEAVSPSTHRRDVVGKGALDDEDIVERTGRADEALTNEDGDEVDVETAAAARRSVH